MPAAAALEDDGDDAHVCCETHPVMNADIMGVCEPARLRCMLTMMSAVTLNTDHIKTVSCCAILSMVAWDPTLQLHPSPPHQEGNDRH
jgi:hypothetical protein